MKIKILIPIYNDWQSVFKLVDEINNLSIDSKFEISIIIVNDASNHDRQNEDKNLCPLQRGTHHIVSHPSGQRENLDLRL